MAWIPIAAAVVSAVGSKIGADSRNSAESQFVDRQQDFQERMSSTAHQREVADLRAAGLNPILSARLGGASSPAGSKGTAVDSIGEATRSGVSSAMQGAALEASLDQMKAQTASTNATTSKTMTDDSKSLSENVKIIEETKKVREETSNQRRIGAILDEEVQSAKAAATRASSDEEFYATPLGQFMRKLGLGASEIGKLFGAGNSARSLTR